MNVAGVLLAAGAGTRYGGPKALARLGDRLLVERGVELLTAGGCAPVVVVLGAAAAEVVAAADLGAARAVVNPDWASGLASSLAAGLAAADAAGATGAVVTLVDQPALGSAAVARVAALAPAAGAAVATYGGRRGHPVLLKRGIWAAVLAAADGDTGAGPWLRAHPELVVEVPCDGTGDPMDVDTPGQLQVLEESRHPCT